jgi:group I intron endonuclease
LIIYKTTNIITGKIYVGKDCGRHRNYLGSGTYLLRAIKKYGRNNFKREVLEICSAATVCKREIFWIKKLDARNKKVGYNISIGGDGRGSGFKHSAATIKKIAKAHIGLWHTEAAKRKISMAKKGAGLGGHLSEETRRKLSAINTGKHHSKETRLLMSLQRTGRRASVETKLLMSNIRMGKKLSEETKRKISIAHLGMHPSKEAVAKMAASLIGRSVSEDVKRRISNSMKIRLSVLSTAERSARMLLAQKQRWKRAA